MEYIDYYKVLGVDRSASQEEISKAYKRMARKYHPDLNKSPDAEKRFKEINEAHEVLKDPETRKRFDTLGANWKHGAPFEPPPGWGPNVHYEFHGSPGGGGGFSDFFDAIFGGGMGGGRKRGSGGGFGAGLGLDDLFGGRFSFGGNGQSRSTPQGQDVESTLTISLQDAYRGSKKTVELSGPNGRRRYDLKIPKGIRDGEKMRLGGQGVAGGDLYLTIKLAPHPQFSVEGDDLVVEVEVKVWDAALGTKVQVPTLDGRLNMSLPAGCSSGQRLRLKGKGLPRRGGGSGDLYALVKLVVPKRLTKQQRQLFARLKETGE
jgi:curved DNA-binding protein